MPTNEVPLLTSERMLYGKGISLTLSNFVIKFYLFELLTHTKIYVPFKCIKANDVKNKIVIFSIMTQSLL